MKRSTHPIVLGCLVEGLLAAFFVSFWTPGGDSPMRLIVAILHIPGLLTSRLFNLGNGDEVMPAILVMLGLWILFFYRLRAHLAGPDRQKPITASGLKIIALVTVLGIAAVLLVWRFGPLPRQLKNMAAANQHIQILRPMLDQDARFTNVKLHTYSAAGGSLLLAGELLSDGDLADLKQIVLASKPPVEVVYQVYIFPPELLELRKRTDDD